MERGSEGTATVVAVALLIGCVVWACAAAPRKTEVWPAGKTLGGPTKFKCLGSYGPAFIDLKFPARGGCMTSAPVEVDYKFLDAGLIKRGGNKLWLQRTILKSDEDTSIGFSLARQLQLDGKAIDVVDAGYSLEVTVSGNCHDQGRTTGTAPCVLAPP